MRWLPYRNFSPPFSTLRCDKQSVNNEQPPSLLLHFEKAHSTICERELIHHMSSPLRVIFLFHSVNYFACFGRIGERPTTINHARRAIAVFLRALKGGRERENTSRVISTFALLPSVCAAVTAMRQFLWETPPFHSGVFWEPGNGTMF